VTGVAEEMWPEDWEPESRAQVHEWPSEHQDGSNGRPDGKRANGALAQALMQQPTPDQRPGAAVPTPFLEPPEESP
jgi:hypothetical protein